LKEASISLKTTGLNEKKEVAIEMVVLKKEIDSS